MLLNTLCKDTEAEDGIFHMQEDDMYDHPTLFVHINIQRHVLVVYMVQKKNVTTDDQEQHWSNTRTKAV
jgi:hypothetical protein